MRNLLLYTFCIILFVIIVLILDTFIIQTVNNPKKKEIQLQDNSQNNLFKNNIFIKNGIELDLEIVPENRTNINNKIPIERILREETVLEEQTSIKIENTVDCLAKFQECDLTDKFSCTMCQGRANNYSCVKLNSDMEIYNNKGLLIGVLNASKNNMGYCLENITINQTRTCNPYAGNWILIRHKINKIKEIDNQLLSEIYDPIKHSTEIITKQINTNTNEKEINLYGYMFVCKCKMPHVIGQQNFNSDCVVSRSCGQHNKLETVYIAPSKAKCLCSDKDDISDNIENIPVCRKKRFIELEKDDLYTISFPHKLPLTHPGINNIFSNQFIHKTKRNVINPCKIDAFSGEEINESELVQINQNSKNIQYSGETDIWYCKPLSNNIATVLYSTDFLTGNNGKYANGVYRISNSQTNSEIQEWNVPYLENYTQNSKFGPPIIGVKTNFHNLKTTNLNLYLILEKFYKPDKINTIYFYNFITHILSVSATIEQHTDLHSYYEHNTNPQIPIKKLFLWPAVYKKSDAIDINPRFCHKMISKSGKDEIWPPNFIYGELDENLHSKLLHGGAFIGCILDKTKLISNNKHLKLFVNLYNGYYVANGLNLENTNIIEIDHLLKLIKPIWLGTNDEKRKWLEETSSGALYFLRTNEE